MRDWVHHGLNLSRPDESTSQEWEAWRAHERATRGYPLPAWDVLGRLRPDAVKRWLVEQQATKAAPGAFSTVLTHVHLYAVQGFGPGVLYAIDIAARAGHPREEVVDALALALLSTPSVGLHELAPAVEERLSRYPEPREPFRWPDGWSRDPAALRSGVDFSSRSVADGDAELIRDWYVRTTGEVPRFVDFLARHAPATLRAHRDRLEHALRTLPVQALPFLLITLETANRSDDGIRDALLLARGLGVTRAQAVSAVLACMPQALRAELSAVERVAGDVLADW